MTAADPVKPTEALRPPERDPVHLVGTIHHVEAEGGVYVIRTESGDQYRLVELPEQFRQEGLSVMVEGLQHDDVLTEDMAGQSHRHREDQQDPRDDGGFAVRQRRLTPARAGRTLSFWLIGLASGIRCHN